MILHVQKKANITALQDFYRAYSLEEKDHYVLITPSAIKEVDDNDDLMIITKAGILIRSSVAELRVMGRNTQGVKLIRLKNESDEISSVTKIEKEPEPEEVEILEGAEATEGVEVISEGDASTEGNADVSTEDSEGESTEGDIADDSTEE